MPPAIHLMPAHLSAAVVSELAAEFDIGALLSDEANELATLPSAKELGSKMVAMTSSKMATDEEEFDDGEHEDGGSSDEDADMDQDDDFEDDDGEDADEQVIFAPSSVSPYSSKATPF